MTNAVSTFQRMMELVLGDAVGRICFVYIDDIIVFGRTSEELVKNLEIVFELLEKANLTLSASKCVFFT